MSRLAVVVVRDGALPLGAGEAVAEAGGRCLLVGSGAAAAAEALGGIADEVRIWEAGAFAPGAWADALVDELAGERVLVLPASADGRDLAPRLAHALRRPLLAGATAVHDQGAALLRRGGQVALDATVDGPFVATLEPGIRGVEATAGGAGAPTPTVLGLALPAGAHDAEVVDVLAPDVATMDLAEAPRILGGGAGLDDAERFEQLARLGVALGAAVGATRVVTDRGWAGHERQIGTTGVAVSPRTYLAFGISGAVQHTAGLGTPEHVISVNTDPHCPMMAMADLAIVSDANAVLDELERRLGPAMGAHGEEGRS